MARPTHHIGQPAWLIRLFIAALFPLLAGAQPEGGSVGLTEPRGVSKSEPTSGEDNAVELPFSQIFRDTEPPYERLFRDVRLGGRITPKVGSADALFESHLFGNPFLRTPLDRGLPPKDADLKLGGFYLDVRALSGSLLFSDNVRLTTADREAGAISIVRLTSAATFQIGDALQLHTLATLVWLPFRSEIGVAGFGIGDPLAGFTAGGPLSKAQLTYDGHLAGWDIGIFDVLGSRARRFGAGMGFDLLDGESFDEEDRAGRYVFRDRTPVAGTGSPGSWDSRFGVDLIEARNLIGASASRMLPTETRFEFGGSHADCFYSGAQGGGLPNSRDQAYVLLVSERETMRFKPYARYRVYRFNNQDNWDQEGHAGIHGPISEHLTFLGEAGYFEGGGAEGGTLLWNARLRHSLNPLTFQQLRYSRGTTEPDRGFHESLSYWLTHAFRPDLVGRLYAIHSTFHALGREGSGGDEDRAGVRLTYDLAQRTLLQMAGNYTRIRYDNPAYVNSDNWSARAEISHRYRKGLEGWLIYQYRNRDFFSPERNLHENLVTLTVIKHF